MISKRLKELKEPLEIDIQLIATELDTSANDMKCICEKQIYDANTLDAFNKMFEDITKVNGVEITSFDDNTVLYEYLNEPIVIYTLLGIKYIIFDSIITQKIEGKLYSYR